MWYPGHDCMEGIFGRWKGCGTVFFLWYTVLSDERHLQSYLPVAWEPGRWWNILRSTKQAGRLLFGVKARSGSVLFFFPRGLFLLVYEICFFNKKKKRENCLTHETTKAEVVKCFKFQNASGPLTRPAPMESEVALGGPPPQSGLPKSCNSFKLHFKTIQLPNNTQAYILAGEIIQLSII